jgi:hypothetical protein
MISSYQHLVSVLWRCIYHLLQSSQCFLNSRVPHIWNVYLVGVDFKVHLDAQKKLRYWNKHVFVKRIQAILKIGSSTQTCKQLDVVFVYMLEAILCTSPQDTTDVKQLWRKSLIYGYVIKFIKLFVTHVCKPSHE